MANNKSTYQQVHNVSINKEKLAELASNPSLSKKDYKVLLLLFTQLDGYRMPTANERARKDPLNFSIVDIEKIASCLDMSKKAVKKCIENIYFEGYLEEGSNTTIRDGYRFTF